MVDGVVKIDETQCNGCGLCVNVCPFHAIVKEEA
jgi:indolepyruvate ferredoxin oxidoreductase alpha subunit